MLKIPQWNTENKVEVLHPALTERIQKKLLKNTSYDHILSAEEKKERTKIIQPNFNVINSGEERG